MSPAGGRQRALAAVRVQETDAGAVDQPANLGEREVERRAGALQKIGRPGAEQLVVLAAAEREVERVVREHLLYGRMNGERGLVNLGAATAGSAQLFEIDEQSIGEVHRAARTGRDKRLAG